MRNDKPILSIIIPVFNEVKTVGEIIGRVAQINIPHEIVVVDDCSTDGTREMLSSIRPRTFRLIFNPSNQGKGACVKKALKKAKGRIVVIQDADLEYFPEEIPKLVEPIISGKADMVIGKRVGETVYAHPNYLAHYKELLEKLSERQESRIVQAEMPPSPDVRLYKPEKSHHLREKQSYETSDEGETAGENRENTESYEEGSGDQSGGAAFQEVEVEDEKSRVVDSPRVYRSDRCEPLKRALD